MRMNKSDFKVELDNRGPFEWVALVFSVGFSVYALVISAPKLFTWFVCLITLSILVPMIRNKKRGLLLTETTLSMYEGSWQQQVQLADVSKFIVKSWSDSTDAELLMRDGKTIPI